MKMFVIELDSPWRPIKQYECEIRTKKQVWAILPDGRRKLVSSSAFINEQGAKRTQIAKCIEGYQSSYKKTHLTYGWNACKEFLEKENIQLT